MAKLEDDDKPDLGVEIPDANVKIDLTEDDDELLEGGQATKPDDEQRTRDPETGKWSKKKAERGANKREENGWRKEKADYDARLQRMQADNDRQLSELRQQIQQAQQRPAPGAPHDPFVAPITDVRKQIAAELQLIENQPGRNYDRYNELREKESELIARRTWTQMNAQQQRNQEPASPYANRIPFIESEFPWTREPRFKDLAVKAQAIKVYLTNVEGRPDTLDTDREALTTAVARFGGEFGLRAPAAPTQRQRNIYAGPGPSGGAQRAPQTSEVEIPRQLVNGTGLTAAALRDALRDIER